MAHSELTGLSDWTAFNSRNVYTNRNFQRILNFFLFECPNKHMSVRSHPFHEQGWPKKYFSVLQRRLRKAGDPEIAFHRVAIKNLFETLSLANQLAAVDCTNELVIYHGSGESMVTLFGAIRNAFAHGSYQIRTVNKVRYYCLENRTPPSVTQPNYFDQEVRARIVLKETTLLRWIEIIQSERPNTAI